MGHESIIKRNIRIIRMELGMTQEEFGDELGVSRPAIGSYEEGRALPSIGVLIKIADLYGVMLDELIRIPMTTKFKSN
jgi:transcriptional regulator with XRE-family HTH domain